MLSNTMNQPPEAAAAILCLQRLMAVAAVGTLYLLLLPLQDTPDTHLAQQGHIRTPQCIRRLLEVAAVQVPLHRGHHLVAALQPQEW